MKTVARFCIRIRVVMFYCNWIVISCFRNSNRKADRMVGPVSNDSYVYTSTDYLKNENNNNTRLVNCSQSQIRDRKHGKYIILYIILLLL